MRLKPAKTIPSIIGLLLLTVLVFGGVYLTQRLGRTTTQIAASRQPLSVRVANITDRAAVVYWLTEEATEGSIKLNDKIYLDNRDRVSSQAKKRFTHYVAIDDLLPGETYHFAIISQGQIQQKDSFQFTTAQALIGPPAEVADLAFGIILDNQQNQPLADTLVTLSLPGATNLASLTDDNGFWSIPLSTAYQKDLSRPISYDREKEVLEILVESRPGLSSTVITNTGNDHPVPPIIIGKSYDFSQNPPTPRQQPEDFDWTNPLETVEEINNSSFFLPQEQIDPKEAQAVININDPQEGETVFTAKPEFSGRGPANQTIKVTLESPKKFEEEIVVSAFGSWQWSPPEHLTPGRHTLTVEYHDENNILHVVSRTFIVQASSISPSPTPIVPLPTIPPQVTPTPTPVRTTPTPTPVRTTPSPTPLPTITPIIKEATAPAEIVSGNLTPLVILAILGLGLIYFAFVVHQKKR